MSQQDEPLSQVVSSSDDWIVVGHVEAFSYEVVGEQHREYFEARITAGAAFLDDVFDRSDEVGSVFEVESAVSVGEDVVYGYEGILRMVKGLSLRNICSMCSGSAKRTI